MFGNDVKRISLVGQWWCNYCFYLIGANLKYVGLKRAMMMANNWIHWYLYWQLWRPANGNLCYLQILMWTYASVHLSPTYAFRFSYLYELTLWIKFVLDLWAKEKTCYHNWRTKIDLISRRSSFYFGGKWNNKRTCKSEAPPTVSMLYYFFGFWTYTLHIMGVLTIFGYFM